MKKLKSYEVIDLMGKSHFISAYTKNNVSRFWGKCKKIIYRNDIDASTNLNIE